MINACSNSRSAAPPRHFAVADSSDNRILIFSLPLSASESPSVVIGQSSFTLGSPNQGQPKPSASSLVQPGALATDSAGDLWVADTNNCRVLEFQPPFTTGMSASLVIGQPDFESSQVQNVYFCFAKPSLPASRLETPASLAFDSHGDLWVADSTADRVLEFVPPFSNGMEASVVIGQTSMDATGPCNGLWNGPLPPATDATLCQPSSVAFDTSGNLWVADERNSRILEFLPPFTTGMSASLDTVGRSPTSNFSEITAIDFDRGGSLWVADAGFGRVQEFSPPFTSGMSANLTIGQSSLIVPGLGYTPLASPLGLLPDGGGNIYISASEVGGADFGSILDYSSAFTRGKTPSILLSGKQCPSTSWNITANTLCQPTGMAEF